jgi:hypothetical protein
METPELNDDFLDMLDAFGGAGVEFVVVGAHALAAHGLPRATGDLDLLVRPSPANAARVVQALEAFGAPLADHGVLQADFEIEGTVYQIGLPPRRIDILTKISGVSFDEANASKVLPTLAGRSVPVLGRDALLKNKRAAARDKDLVDVRALEGQKR